MSRVESPERRSSLTAASSTGEWFAARTVRLSGLVVAMLLIADALSSDTFRREDGWLLPTGWTLVVIGLSITIAALGWKTVWQKCAMLSALALFANACALQLIDAPPYAVYQHYARWSDLIGSRRAVFLIGPLLQTIFIIAWLVQRREAIRNFRRFTPAAWQLAVLGVVLVFGLACPSEGLFRYGGELVMAGWIVLASAANLALIAATIPKGAMVTGASWVGRHLTAHAVMSKTQRCFPWLVAAIVTLASAQLCWSVMERVPHIPDSVSYLFQAKYFSTGRLYLPAPAEAESFAITHVVNDGEKWYGYGLPGWPALLALGFVFHVPWLVNPLLAGCTILLAHRLVCQLYDRTLANLVILLLAVSPWFLFMSASFMAHPSSLVWTLFALLAVQRERSSGLGLWASLAGVSLGCLFLTRPLEGLIVGILAGLWSIGFGGPAIRVRGVVGLVSGSILIGSLFFVYNATLTGDPLYAPHMKWTDETYYPGVDRLGFGPNVGNVDMPHFDPLPGHGPLDVVLNTNRNFFMTNVELFGWGSGSLLMVAIFFLVGGWRRSDLLFLGFVIFVPLGHAVFWSSGGPDYGARYWYQLLVPLTILTARGMEAVGLWLAGRGATDQARFRLYAMVAVASLITVISYLPWRSMDKYHRYRGMSADVRELARANGIVNSVVFVRTSAPEDYWSAFVFNPRSLDDPGTLYVRDIDAEQRARLARGFASRDVWILGGTSEEQPHLRVLAGPMSADDLSIRQSSRRVSSKVPRATQFIEKQYKHEAHASESAPSRHDTHSKNNKPGAQVLKLRYFLHPPACGRVGRVSGRGGHGFEASCTSSDLQRSPPRSFLATLRREGEVALVPVRPIFVDHTVTLA